MPVVRKTAISNPIARSGASANAIDGLAPPLPRREPRNRHRPRHLAFDLPVLPHLRRPTRRDRQLRLHFDIFVDAATATATPTPQASGPSTTGENEPGRRILASSEHSPNASPVPATRRSDQPFRFVPSDPLWTDKENMGPDYYAVPNSPANTTQRTLPATVLDTAPLSLRDPRALEGSFTPVGSSAHRATPRLQQGPGGRGVRRPRVMKSMLMWR